jgi:hypothetical protein
MCVSSTSAALEALQSREGSNVNAEAILPVMSQVSRMVVFGSLGLFVILFPGLPPCIDSDQQVCADGKSAGDIGFHVS